MSKELTTMKDYWSQSNLGSEDFSIPRVKIGQPTSDGEAGKFLFNDGSSLEEIKSARLIVPRKTRVLFSGTKRARCKSDDFYSPSSFVVDPISSSCLTCFAKDWGESVDKERLAVEVGAKDFNKPLCAETYNLLMADIDWNLFFITFQKTQLKVVSEKLFSRLRSMGRPAFEVGFDMGLSLVASPGKKYYQVVFSNFEVLPDSTIGRQLWESYSKRAAEILSQQHEEMDRSHEERAVEEPEELPF